MKLPKCEKDKVAAQDPFITSSSVYLNILSVGMITQGISYNKVLDRVRETSGGSRASILEKQDILNVARDYGLHQIQSRHPEDSISVRFIVQELKEANDWHTDRTFRKSIASKITAPTSEKAVIYQMDRALMDEPDEQIFNQECQGFL
ncbi:hypothetical protein Pcinc_023249 [Petrolisthes cinctipes]|uniref:Uncharacterized protein n=1 Tax=Petrolisthes cinctipes TaxID=88211 RepID=A0AAE1KES0_PETCI|nr:hypothetical protein Pcinc_023249 [Petrolisthes cinctipes]